MDLYAYRMCPHGNYIRQEPTGPIFLDDTPPIIYKSGSYGYYDDPTVRALPDTLYQPFYYNPSGMLMSKRYPYSHTMLDLDVTAPQKISPRVVTSSYWKNDSRSFERAGSPSRKWNSMGDLREINSPSCEVHKDLYYKSPDPTYFKIKYDDAYTKPYEYRYRQTRTFTSLEGPSQPAFHSKRELEMDRIAKSSAMEKWFQKWSDKREQRRKEAEEFKARRRAQKETESNHAVNENIEKSLAEEATKPKSKISAPVEDYNAPEKKKELSPKPEFTSQKLKSPPKEIEAPAPPISNDELVEDDSLNNEILSSDLPISNHPTETVPHLVKDPAEVESNPKLKKKKICLSMGKKSALEEEEGLSREPKDASVPFEESPVAPERVSLSQEPSAASEENDPSSPAVPEERAFFNERMIESEDSTPLQNPSEMDEVIEEKIIPQTAAMLTSTQKEMNELESEPQDDMKIEASVEEATSIEISELEVPPEKDDAFLKTDKEDFVNETLSITEGETRESKLEVFNEEANDDGLGPETDKPIKEDISSEPVHEISQSLPHVEAEIAVEDDSTAKLPIEFPEEPSSLIQYNDEEELHLDREMNGEILEESCERQTLVIEKEISTIVEIDDDNAPRDTLLTKTTTVTVVESTGQYLTEEKELGADESVRIEHEIEQVEISDDKE